METLAGITTRFPKTVIAAILAVTAGALLLLLRPGLEMKAGSVSLILRPALKMDANPYPLAKTHPSMVAYHKLKTEFTGTLETGLIHLRHPVSIFNQATLQRISGLTAALEEISLDTTADEKELAARLPGLPQGARGPLAAILQGGIGREDDLEFQELVDWAEQNPAAAPGLLAALEEVQLKLYPIKEVTSLANVENIVARGDELVVGKVYENLPESAADWERLRASVRSNDIFRGLLVSKDERSTGIQVEVYIPDDRSDLMYDLNLAMLDVLERAPGIEETHLAGFPIMAATFMNSMQKDNATFLPLVMALVVLILFLIFRAFSGVALPMAVVVISVIWTLAIMVLSGVPMNMMLTMLPVFLVAIGVADGVHLVTEFRDQFREGRERREAVRSTMRFMTLPVVMTSITTSVGFLSLSFTDINVIQKFGIFVAVGVMAAMVFSLTFIPAALSLGRKRPRASTGGRATGGLLRRIDALFLAALVALSGFAVRRARPVLLVSAVLVLAGGYGMTRIVADNDFTTYFPADMPIIQSIRALDEHMAGSNIVNVLVHAPPDGEDSTTDPAKDSFKDSAKDPFKDPANLALVEGLQKDLATNPIVGKSVSLVDVLKRINLVLHSNDPAYNRLPKTVERVPAGRGSSGTVTVSGRDMVSQYLLLYENGGGENLSDNVDSDFSTMNVAVFMNSQKAVKIASLIEQARAYVAANFPPGMRISFTGSAELAITTNNEIVKTQITSLAISLVVIFFLLLIEFRSIAKGLLAIIPLAATVILNFGIIGLLGINLNIAIAIMSSIVIGVGVDFAIHYLSRLQIEMQRNVSRLEAFANTMRASGKAISANAAVVAIGFIALAFSNLYPMQLMGLLITQTLLLSAFATLVLLPAAAVVFAPAFVRERGGVAAGADRAGEAEGAPDMALGDG